MTAPDEDRRLAELRERLRAAHEDTSRRERHHAARDARFSVARLSAFGISVAGFVVTAATQNDAAGWFVLVPFFVIFLVLIVLHQPVRRELLRLRRIVALIEAKLARLDSIDHDESAWRTRMEKAPEELLDEADRIFGDAAADEYALPAHVRGDLAIHDGQRHLVGLADSTATRLGGLAVLRRLTHLVLDRRELDARQEASRELLGNTRLREKLEQQLDARRGAPDREALRFLFEGDADVGDLARLRSVPLFTLVVGALVVASIVFESFLLFVLAVVWAAIGNWVHGRPAAATAALRGETTRHRPIWELAVGARDLLASGGCTSERLGELERRLDTLARDPLLHRCFRSLRALAVYKLGLFYVILNWMFLWDLYFIAPIVTFWRKRRDLVRDAYAALGELEALVAFANLAEEQPGWTWPEVVDARTPELAVTGGAHPLIDSGRVVANPIDLSTAHRTMIVTGSNMSGKSTYIRMSGLSVVLAQAGAPVRAESMRLTPLALDSDINVRDSLDSGESYFSVEVDRVAGMLRLAEERPHSLFLLDEVFRGTNTNEKVAAGTEVARYLAACGALSIVATHDHELTGLETEEPDLGMLNYHFLDAVEDGRMTFDYLLRRGPAPGRNAIRLLRHRGYPEELVRRALERATGPEETTASDE